MMPTATIIDASWIPQESTDGRQLAWLVRLSKSDATMFGSNWFRCWLVIWIRNVCFALVSYLTRQRATTTRSLVLPFCFSPPFHQPPPPQTRDRMQLYLSLSLSLFCTRLNYYLLPVDEPFAGTSLYSQAHLDYIYSLRHHRNTVSTRNPIQPCNTHRVNFDRN